MKRLLQTPFRLFTKGFFLFLMFTMQFSLHAQWEFVGSPEKLDFVEFANDGNRTYVASVGNIHYTNDDGATWHSIPNTTPFIEIKALKSFDGKLFVKADSYGRSDQLFVSADQGVTWEAISMMNNYTGTMDHFAVRGDTILMNIGNKFLVSIDGGLSVAYESSLAPALHLNQLLWHGNTVIVRPLGGHGDEISLRSTDLGKTWVADTVSYIKSFTSLGDQLWRHHEDPATNAHFISLSLNEGSTWDEKLMFTSYPHFLDAFMFGDEDQIFIGHTNEFGNRLARSTNEGLSWNFEEQESLSKNGYLWADDKIYAHFVTEGVATSTNLGASWTLSNAGIKEDRPYSLIVPEGNVIWTSNYVTRDGGLSWSEYPDTIQYVATSGDGHMVGSLWKKIFVSDDAGLTWTFVHELPIQGNSIPWEIFYLGGKFIITLYTGQMSSSDDGGLTWSPVIQFPGRFYEVGFNDGKYYTKNGNKIFISDDALTWQDVTYNLFDVPGNKLVEGMLMIDSKLISYYKRMHALELPEQEWKPYPYIASVPLHPDNLPVVDHMIAYEEVLLAAIIGLGVYVSYDDALSWTPFNDGLTNLRASRITFDDEFIYLGMNSGGVWKRPLADLGSYNLIEGFVYYDENQNAIFDPTESPLGGIPVSSARTGIVVNTLSDGSFKLYTNYSGLDTIEAQVPYINSYFTTSIVEVAGSLDSVLIGVYYDTIYSSSVDITAVTPPRPGFQFNLQLQVYNKGSFTSDMTLVLYPDSSPEFIDASIAPDVVTVDSLVWFIDNLGPGSFFTVELTYFLPSNVNLGNIVTFKAKVTHEGDEHDPTDNIALLDAIVVGSFDPNDKAVAPNGPLSPAMLADTASLTYAIRFQNLGNYQADRVHIVDTISMLLDINSIQILAGSHEYTWRIGEGRALEVSFDNIFLPYEDEDEPGSHGFIKYSINALPEIELGESIKNKAYIFFDFNPPIVTNETESPIAEITVGLGDQNNYDREICQLSINPNPANDFIQILSPEISNGQVSVMDQKGRLVMATSLAYPEKASLDIRALPAGLFTIMVSDGKQRCAGSFIKF